MRSFCEQNKMTPLFLYATELHRILNYDPHTGEFTWLEKRTPKSNRVKVGSKTGYLARDGFVAINLGGKPYRAHLLAWLWMTGRWALEEVEHKNGVRHDNRWENLGEASHARNHQKRIQANKNNSTGLLGASIRDKGGYLSQIHARGKNYNLGTFDTPEKAHEAYLKAKAIYHDAQ